MIKNKNIISKILVILSFWMLISCQYKPLYLGKDFVSEVRINFIWPKGKGLDVESMNIWFYPLDGGEPQLRQLSREGGTVHIPYDTYKMVWINGDSQSILYKNSDDWNKFELYTRQSYRMEPLGLRSDNKLIELGDEPIYLSQDKLWSGRHLSKKILPPQNGVQIVDCPVEDKLSTYTLDVLNVRNLPYVTGVSSSISGMASSYYPAIDQISKERCTLPFECKKGITEKNVHGELRLFGPAAGEPKMYYIVLYFILSDGTQWVSPRIDVTDQVLNAPDPKNVHIVIDGSGIKVPKPISKGDGFRVKVEDWEDAEELEINM